MSQNESTKEVGGLLMFRDTLWSALPVPSLVLSRPRRDRRKYGAGGVQWLSIDPGKLWLRCRGGISSGKDVRVTDPWCHVVFSISLRNGGGWFG